MKKIYLSLAALFLVGASFGQQVMPKRVSNSEKAHPVQNLKSRFQSNSAAVADQVHYIEPIGDIMINKGLLLDGSASADQDLFLAANYMDSSVVISSPTSTRNISNILLGTVLDPTAVLLDSLGAGYFSHNDAYNIDSVFILASYVKVTPNPDTLYVWLVWGDTTNTNTWVKRASTDIWLSPLGDWRPNIIGAKVTGYGAGHGNKVTAAAATTNQVLTKYVLTDSDSSQSGFLKFISVGLSTPAAIPAGNIVSCFYTFVPGGAHNFGDCSYAFTGSTVAQNVNGFGGATWGQTNPAVNAVSDYQDHQVDPDSWNMGASYYNEQRYGVYPAQYNNSMWGDLASAPYIVYRVYGTSTVGVNETSSNGITVKQNTPNPFSKQTTIAYELKDAAAVSFVITDIMGRTVSTFEQGIVSAGKNKFTLNTDGYANGVYFYTLKAGDKTITKKMIISE